MKPNFPRVCDLIKSRDSIVGNCAVLLVRPYPDMSQSRIPYDVESIWLLKPKHICVVYRADGGDGSSELHSLLHQCGLPSSCDFNYPRRKLARVASYVSNGIILQNERNVSIPTCAVISRTVRFKTVQIGVTDMDALTRVLNNSLNDTANRLL